MYINVNSAQCLYLLCKLNARISQTSQHSDYCKSCKPNTRSLSLIYKHTLRLWADMLPDDQTTLSKHWKQISTSNIKAQNTL